MHNKFATIFFCLLATFKTLHGQNFRDVSEVSGINTSAVDPVLMAGGVVWFDYNNDFYPDLLFVNGEAPLRLYRNDWDGTFTDVSENSGLLSVANAMGAVTEDLDGDGYKDIFITTFAGEPNVLLRNKGDGAFENISVSAGISHIAYSSSATIGDPDGDGDPDIYVANYLNGMEASDGGQPNFLYRNDGDFRFTEVASRLGLADAGCGLGATFTDVNLDGRQDLYVANDFGYLILANEMFINETDGFKARATRNGSAATINAMGIAKGDYDNDGDPDLYITNIRGNPLFKNVDEGNFFSYASAQAGVDLPELTSWGTSFTDFNLDGLLDLVVANGQVAEVVNGPEPTTLFLNEGDGGFVDISEASGMEEVKLIGRGLAVADYDLDGLPDVAMNAVQEEVNGVERARLLHNTSAGNGHWLAVSTPFGALRLELYAGGETLFRETDGGSSYLSHSAVPVYFGSITSSDIDSLVVHFQDVRSVFHDVPWDQLIAVNQDGSWQGITHISTVRCAAEPAAPLISSSMVTDADGKETLLIERLVTEVYTRRPVDVVELMQGDVYRGLARTRDTMLVDTLTSDTGCPVLQPVAIRITPANEELRLYPNPVVDDLTVLLNTGGGSLEVDIFSVSGRLIHQRLYDLGESSRRVTVSLKQLPPGGYLIRLSHNGQITHHKLIRR